MATLITVQVEDVLLAIKVNPNQYRVHWRYVGSAGGLTERMSTFHWKQIHEGVVQMRERKYLVVESMWALPPNQDTYYVLLEPLP